MNDGEREVWNEMQRDAAPDEVEQLENQIKVIIDGFTFHEKSLDETARDIRYAVHGKIAARLAREDGIPRNRIGIIIQKILGIETDGD